jgi:hypothetical protein
MVLKWTPGVGGGNKKGAPLSQLGMSYQMQDRPARSPTSWASRMANTRDDQAWNFKVSHKIARIPLETCCSSLALVYLGNSWRWRGRRGVLSQVIPQHTASFMSHLQNEVLSHMVHDT